MAAGGNEWRLISLRDASRIFQEDGGGPWLIQRHYIVEIMRKVHSMNVDVTPNVVGTKSPSISFSISGRTLFRGLSGGGENAARYICREDAYETLDEASNYVNQKQVWEWLEPEDQATEI